MIPAQEPTGQGQNRPTLRRNATGDLVKSIQAKLHIMDNGTFDADVEASVRQFQREHNLVPDGIVGPKTWIALDAA